MNHKTHFSTVIVLSTVLVLGLSFLLSRYKLAPHSSTKQHNYMEQVSAKFYDIHGQLLYTLHAEHSTLSKKVWQLTNLSLQHFQNQKIDYETHSKHGMYLEKNRQLELRDQVQIHIQPSPSQAETTIHTEIANIDFKKHSISSQKPSYFKNNTNDLEASGFHYLWQPEAKMLLFNIKSTLATRQSQHIAQEQD